MNKGERKAGAVRPRPSPLRPPGMSAYLIYVCLLPAGSWSGFVSTSSTIVGPSDTLPGSGRDGDRLPDQRGVLGGGQLLIGNPRRDRGPTGQTGAPARR